MDIWTERMSTTTTMTGTPLTTTSASTSSPNSSTTKSEPSSKDVLTDLGFEKISDAVSLYTPPISTNTNQKSTTTSPPPSNDSSGISDPTLLILCSWAFAQPKHIAKYLAPYKTLYPQTSILLIQNVVGNMIWMADTWQYPFFQPAATVIQAHVSATVTPGVLVHIFSNGGSHAAVQLSETCREMCGGLRMPIDALILDSCPGIPRYRPTINALVQGVPNGAPLAPVLKATTAALAWMMVTTTALLESLGIMELAARKLYRKLADPYDVFMFKGVPKSEKKRSPVPRTYMYSKSDTMIMAEDIVTHANTARAEMQKVVDVGLATGDEDIDVKEFVRLEEFVGTAHVNHVKNESERYWSLVKETWARSQQT